MNSFNERLLRWFDTHGRKTLPWQRNKTPYRVWVSEIMLQQTQVSTVIPYFEKFMGRFPDVVSLADAPVDEVLHHWTGLGYYARARNLHKAACQIRDTHAGCFPGNKEQIQALPGIGRSTAAAILAIAYKQRHAILDGNVKRVLARHRQVDGWPGEKAVESALWALADAFTPEDRVAEYTQAIMDLGATICTRARPRCDQCPVAEDCLAGSNGLTHAYPVKRQKKSLLVRQTVFVILTDENGRVLMEKRPAAGIWGGLVSFPEIAAREQLKDWCQQALHCAVEEMEIWPAFRHTFSHFHLDITPLRAHVRTNPPVIMEPEGYFWYKADQQNPQGMSAPVSRLLARLAHE